MIVKCSHCGLLTSSEKFDNHECDFTYTRSKIIEVAYFRDDSHKNKQVITAMGLDKVLYTFEVLPRKAIQITVPLSRRMVTAFKTDDKETEPSQTI